MALWAWSALSDEAKTHFKAQPQCRFLCKVASIPMTELIILFSVLLGTPVALFSLRCIFPLCDLSFGFRIPWRQGPDLTGIHYFPTQCLACGREAVTVCWIDLLKQFWSAFSISLYTSTNKWCLAGVVEDDPQPQAAEANCLPSFVTSASLATVSSLYLPQSSLSFSLFCSSLLCVSLCGLFMFALC